LQRNNSDGVATLQQRWRCNAQHCYCYGAIVAAARARSDGAVATLAAALLELAAMALLQLWLRRCWSSQRWRCCNSGCGATGARSDGVVAAPAAALLELAAALFSAAGARSDGTLAALAAAILELAAMALLQLWLRQY